MRKKIIRRDVSDFVSEPLLTQEQKLLSRLFFSRGESEHSLQDYQLDKLFKPHQLSGINKALDLLQVALEKQERIVIVGDFDADGATSTALLFRCLKAFGFIYVDYLIPNRFDFGYGLTPEIVDLSKCYQPDLIITVDNGISSHEGILRAQENGVKVLVTDHHLAAETLPPAEAIVNPNQPNCSFPSKNLAGVGVIFYVMLALRAALKEKKYFEKNNIIEPNMAQYLDLVALGTVADVVPLDFNNRVLVAQGLARIRSGRGSTGVNALLSVAGKSVSAISSTDLGFILGPRLNAAGRLDDMSLGVRCLISDDEPETLSIAQQLDSLNVDRRLIEQGMQKEALTALEHIDDSLEQDAAICLYQDDWHQGVVGIVASRIKDRFHRPTIVFAQNDDGSLKGSGRSIPGVHLRDVLDEVAKKQPKVLKKFGGHAMAAGLSLAEKDLPVFKETLNQVVETKLTQENSKPVIVTDGPLHSEYFNLKVAHMIKNAGPWGQHFDEPSFDDIFTLVQQRIVGQKHLKLTLSLKEHSNILVDAIAFNVDIQEWPDPEVKYIHAAYKLDVNEYRGSESLQLIVNYFEKVVL